GGDGGDVQDVYLEAVVETVGRREKSGTGLHAAGEALDRVLRLWMARIAGRALHQRQVAAGRAAHDAEFVRVNLEVGRTRANVADGPAHVLEDFRDCKFRLTAVHDGEDRVTAFEQLAGESRVNGLRGGEPAAADDVNHAGPVGLLRREDIQRQRQAVLAAVNDVAGAREGRVTAGMGGKGRGQQDSTTEKEAAEKTAHELP